MNEVIACSAFELLVTKILQTSEGSESQMTAEYCKRILLFLSLESADQERKSTGICMQSSNCSRCVLHLITLITQDICHFNTFFCNIFNRRCCKRRLKYFNLLLNRRLKYFNSCMKEALQEANLKKIYRQYMVMSQQKYTMVRTKGNAGP